ncbi:MAG: hypothetical protein J0H98_08200 [Solirubrobacterales bacterium]|nr:hypothetical protein [Solirubrobacterales bacterium]
MTPEVLAARLDSVDQKLDAVHVSLKDDVEAARLELREDIGQVRDLASATNGRVRKLEIWQARMQGGLAVSQIAVPAVTGVVSGVVVLLAGRIL